MLLPVEERRKSEKIRDIPFMAGGERRPTQNPEENEGPEIFRGKTGLEVARGPDSGGPFRFPS